MWFSKKRSKLFFEAQLALKYLIPKKRSLSTALISLISIGVVSLVVWLILVFLSVTAGIERNWLAKLTSLQGPIRVAPTEEYYRSYYYQIDSIAASSNFTLKTIGEKAAGSTVDPYSPFSDMEIPPHWQRPERASDGTLLDPVKRAVAAINALQQSHAGLKFQDFEIGGALLKLTLQREGRTTTLSQMSYLLSIGEENPRLSELLIPNEPNLPFAAYVESGKIVLPQGGADTPILLPKSYQMSGVIVGDSGTLSYGASSAAAQEQRMGIRVAGFYDPGFLSLGNRCLLVPKSVTRALYAVTQTSSPDGTPTNGFFLWPAPGEDIATLKQALQERLHSAEVSKYWSVASFDEYEATRDLLEQFRSDKVLFTLVGSIILLVAFCNIVSLLILLVHDKKREIAILQSMGASFWSIGSIFGLSALLMGLTSAAIGLGLAHLTLSHIDSVVGFLSAMQGRAALNPLFFGKELPSQMSVEALTFVLIATPLLSLLAALIPAWKASRIHIATALRSE